MKNINLTYRHNLPPIGMVTQRGITQMVTCCLFIFALSFSVQLHGQNADCVAPYAVDVSAGTVTVMTDDLDNGGSTDLLYINAIGTTTVDLTCADFPGPVTLTLISSTTADGSGATMQCTVDITIDDTTAPNANCVASYGPVVVGDMVTTADLDDVTPNGSSDACSGLASLDIDGDPDYTFTCDDADVGSVTLTLTATDNAGESADCDVTITVTDGVAPVPACADFNYNLSDGPAIDLALVSALSFTDNCTDNVTESVNPNTVACPHDGTFSITYTVTDSDNSSNCTATVTVIDDIDPEITCNTDFSVTLDATGNVSIVDADVIDSSSDNCTGETVALDKYDFSCADIGTNTVTATVTDAAGLTDDCTTVVTVEDNDGPTACVAQDLTVQLDAAGMASITAAQVNGASADNCAVNLISVIPSAFTCTNVGPNTVTLTINDGNNPDVTCTSTVTVQDNEAPDAQCKDATVTLTGNPPMATITTADIDNESDDACGIANMVLDETMFDCSDVSPVTVTLTVTDSNGMTDDCTANVTITQGSALVAMCQPITIDLNATTTITPAMVDNNSSGDCGFAYNNLTPDTFDCTDFDTNNPATVTLVVTDNSNTTASCDAVVTIVNVVAPVAECQTDLTVNLDATGNASILATDLNDGSYAEWAGDPGNPAGIYCGSLSYSASQMTFDCTDVGSPINVTLTVTESISGDIEDCMVIVSVKDVTAPVATCQNFTADLNFGIANISPNDINAGSSDECNALTLLLSQTNFVCADGPTQTVTLTVVDANNNSAQCSAVVTLEDNTPPNAICQDITVSLDNGGMYTAVASEFDNGSNDEELVSDPLRYVIDDNSTSCPVSFVPVSGSSNAVPFGSSFTTINDYPIMDATSINSFNVFDGYTISISSGFSYFVVPATNVFSETADYSGSVTGIFWEEVGDKLIVTWQDVGRAGTPVNVSGEGVTFQYQIDRVTGAIDFLYADTDYSVNDDCDDLACSYISVQREGGGPPEFNAFSNQSSQPGLTCLGYTPVQNGSMVDNCTAAADLTFSIASGETSFDCSALPANGGDGTFTVTVDVSDEAGNVSQCTQTITIEDTEAPTVTCQDVTVSLDATGTYTVTEADVTSGFSDNCEIDFFTFTQSTFTCTDISTSPISVTVGAVDESGNTSVTCTSDVTVVDGIAPTLTCQDITVAVGSTISPSIFWDNSVTAGYTDNCNADNSPTQSGWASDYTIPTISYACADVGTYTETAYFDDASGNPASCTQTITVEDNSPIDVFCSGSNYFPLDVNGDLTIVWQQIAGYNDACVTGVSVSLSQMTFDCDDLGNNVITVTATDGNGNSDVANCNIFIDDNLIPTLDHMNCPTLDPVNPNVTITLDAAGAGIIDTEDFGITSIDNCGAELILWNTSSGTGAWNNSCRDNFGISPSLSLNFQTTQAVDCSNVGLHYIVVFQVNTFNGQGSAFQGGENTGPGCFGYKSQCAVIVKIEDGAAPVAMCMDASVDLDATGNVTIPATLVNNGSTDDCGPPTSTISQSSFDCTEVGDNIVVLTVSDQSGFSSTCTATVTVNDVEAPVASCEDITVELDSDGLATAPVAVDFEDGSTDNCSIVMTSISALSDFDCDDVTGTGSPLSVTFTVTDASGHTDTDVCTVTVVDDMGPELTCTVTQISLADYTEDPLNPGDYIVPKTDVMSCTDNCGIPQAFLDGFFTLDCGSTTVSTVNFNFNSLVDVNGNPQDNPTTCNIKVLGTAPEALCKDITVDLDSNGDGSLMAIDVDNGSDDDCNNVDNFVDGLLDYSVDVSSFTCDDITMLTGLTVPVTLTVTDDDGMTATCVSNVTVRDLIAPMPVCATNIEVQLSSTDGTYTLETMQDAMSFDGGTVENCLYELSIPTTVLDCHSGPTVNVDLTATDPSGNDNTVSCVVNILDPDPVANCITTPIDLTLDEITGMASITVADIDNGSSDICSGTTGLTYALDVMDFDCNSGSSQTVTLTVDDATAGGSASTCTATVNITDAPAVAECDDITVTLIDNAATITAADIDGGSDQVCGGIVTLSIPATSPMSFDCTDEGMTYPVTLEVTYGGNTTSCVSNVTIIKDPTDVCSCIPDNRVESDNPVLDGYYPANQTVISAGTINAPTDVHFRGGVSVTLLPGFTVQQGAIFLGDIGPCDSN